LSLAAKIARLGRRANKRPSTLSKWPGSPRRGLLGLKAIAALILASVNRDPAGGNVWPLTA